MKIRLRVMTQTCFLPEILSASCSSKSWLLATCASISHVSLVRVEYNLPGPCVLLIQQLMGREHQENPLSVYHIDTVLDDLAMPDFKPVVICPSCSTAYPHSELRHCPDGGISRCKYIPLPQSDAREPCGHELGHVVHGKLVPYKIAMYHSVVEWLETFVSLHDKTELDSLFHAWRDRSHDDEYIEDVYDGDFFQEISRCYPVADLKMNGLIFSLFYDGISPFAKNPRSRPETKKRGVGCMFLVPLNFPPQLRHLMSNKCIVSIIEGQC